MRAAVLVCIVVLAGAAATAPECDDQCIVGAHGFDELVRRIIASDRSCANYAMKAVNPGHYRACGREDVADIVAKCISGAPPQCYTHESAAVAYVVFSNAIGVVVWVGLGAVALRESRKRRAADN